VSFSAEPLGRGRRFALLAGVAVIAVLALLAIASRAHATETIYWNNYEAEPSESVAFANIDGSGGGALNSTGAEISDAEGMAFDPANGRIYLANLGSDQIVWVAIDGSGAGVLDTGGAPVESPEGITIDLKTQTVYWANEQTVGSIGYASANGGGGGTLNTAGATVKGPYRPAIDTANNRIYWVNSGSPPEVFASADLGGAGGSNLTLSGAPVPEGVHGINIDPASGRLYWVDYIAKTIGWANVSGVGGGEVAGGELGKDPYGLAFDPSGGPFYWGNYENSEVREKAIGTVTLAGVAGEINPATAPVNGPQDPLILKSPRGTGAPQITQNVASLSCAQGSWSQDYPGSFVYSAPLSYAYQWLANGQAVSGATTSSYTATAGGSYSCSVTGTNQTGSASQTSSAVTVTPAALTATVLTKKPHAKAGKPAVVSLRLANGGQIASAPVSVCATLTKQAKKGLTAPKCAPVVALGNGGSATATLRVKTKKSAKGTYKFTTQVKGATVAPVTVSVKVTAAKHKKKQQKHHKKT
jgi:hypothetical protein